jgi:hypothetical protein
MPKKGKQFGKNKEYTWFSNMVNDSTSHCPKMKINEEKMSKSRFYFPGILVLYPMPKQFEKCRG